MEIFQIKGFRYHFKEIKRMKLKWICFPNSARVL